MLTPLLTGGCLQDLHEMSWLEPHKTFQNSISVFQRRAAGWSEPIHTEFP